jgi:hypothetical protein
LALPCFDDVMKVKRLHRRQQSVRHVVFPVGPGGRPGINGMISEGLQRGSLPLTVTKKTVTLRKQTQSVCQKKQRYDQAVQVTYTGVESGSGSNQIIPTTRNSIDFQHPPAFLLSSVGKRNIKVEKESNVSIDDPYKVFNPSQPIQRDGVALILVRLWLRWSKSAIFSLQNT